MPASTIARRFRADRPSVLDFKVQWTYNGTDRCSLLPTPGDQWNIRSVTDTVLGGRSVEKEAVDVEMPNLLVGITSQLARFGMLRLYVTLGSTS